MPDLTLKPRTWNTMLRCRASGAACSVTKTGHCQKSDEQSCPDAGAAGTTRRGHATVQSSLQMLKAESKKLGETHTGARFSLQLKRDLRQGRGWAGAWTRCEEGAGGEGGEGEGERGWVGYLDLKNRLAAQAQARLNVGENFG